MYIYIFIYVCMYEVWYKINETDFLFTKVSIFFKHHCYPLQNSYLGQLYTNGDIVPTFGNIYTYLGILYILVH